MVFPETQRVRLKRCSKCGEKKPETEFGSNESSSDGLQTYCRSCKNALHKKRRQINTAAYLKHHMAVRVADQLGDKCPKDINGNLEYYLGYRITILVKHLREDLQLREPGKKLRNALNDEGYHIDHITPLHSFKVIKPSGEVNWYEFQRCWNIKNLSAIPAKENLAKGGKIIESTASKV